MIPRTYSFKDVSVVIESAAFGAFVSAGQQGLHEIHVNYATDRTTQAVASDGTVMPSYIAGNNGAIVVSCQQTSLLHSYLTNLYNLLRIAADAGDVTNWATIAISIRSLTDNTQHIAQGVSFQKQPDKPYIAQGQNIAWTLMACDIQTISTD